MDGLIQNSDALAYLVERLAGCCSENDLELNTCKARVFDFFTTHVITSSKKFKYFNFISTAISIDLNWDKNVSAAINKADGKYFESKPDVLTPFCSQTLNNSDRLKPRKRSCIPLFTVMSYGVYAQKELHPSLHSDVIWCLCSNIQQDYANLSQYLISVNTPPPTPQDPPKSLCCFKQKSSNFICFSLFFSIIHQSWTSHETDFD